MNSHEEYVRRMEMARGYFEEGEWAFSLGRWRIACASFQEACENAGKAVLSLYGVVPRTHEVHRPLAEAVQAGLVPEEDKDRVERIADLCQSLGAKEHILIAYGDEADKKSPWEVATRTRAESSREWAREALQLAEQLKKL